jgi:hypothetical protein
VTHAQIANATRNVPWVARETTHSVQDMSDWLGPEGVFVAGKPLTDIWAAPGLAWRDRLTEHLTGPLRHPHLIFVRKDRAHYDLDNLVYPVVAVTGCSACASIWATVETGSEEGVLVRQAIPPSAPAGEGVRRVYLANPSHGSVANRPVPQELVGVTPVGDNEPLGLALAFDNPDVEVGEMSYDGPTKSLVDDLAPVFGWRVVRGRPEGKDDRVRELRITRGHAPGKSGVTVSVWLR